MTSSGYSFAFDPPTISQGERALDHLASELDTRRLDRALVVTSQTVADSDAVMDPLRAALGPKLVGVFDGATPAKYLSTAVEGAVRADSVTAEVIVGLGGGSSLDLAKIVSVLLGHGEFEPTAKRMVETTTVHLPETDLPPVFALPTTLPGADISQVAGVTFSLDPETTPKSAAPSGVASDPRLMPAGVWYDHRLYRATPAHILARSAMNGFDKGIEMIYSGNHTPITDATAVHGIGLLLESLPQITNGPLDDRTVADMLSGIALVQYGLSAPDTYRASIIHAFGHALTSQYPIQQGVAHAIAAPPVLEYLLAQVDGRRELLADALGVEDGSPEQSQQTLAREIVRRAEELRDGLDLPSSLKSVEEADRSDIPTLANAVLADPFMDAAPPDLEPTSTDIESVFDAMW